MFTARTHVVRPCGLIVLLVCGVLGIGSAATPRGATAGANDAKLRALLAERHVTVQAIASEVTRAYEAGTASWGERCAAHRAVLLAELDLRDTDVERVAVLEKLRAMARAQEKATEAAVQAGRARTDAVLAAKVNRLDAELALERATSR